MTVGSKGIVSLNNRRAIILDGAVPYGVYLKERKGVRRKAVVTAVREESMRGNVKA